MSEQKAELLFKKYKTQLIAKLGRKALYNDQLDSIGKQLFKTWNGVNPQDQVSLKPGYQIINVDTSKQSGSHWVAIYSTKKTFYIYDSFARRSTNLLKILTKKLSQKNIKFLDSDRSDAEQFGNKSEVCGQLSLAWLLVVKEMGIRAAMKV